MPSSASNRRVVVEFSPDTAGAALGLVVIAAGSLGPWVSTLLGSVAGIRGDGRITLGLAAFGLLLLLFGRGHVVATTLIALSVIGAGFTAGYDGVHLARDLTQATLFGHQIASVGWGIYAIIAGAFLTLISLAMRFTSLVAAPIVALAAAAAVLATYEVAHHRPTTVAGPAATATGPGVTTSAATTTASTTATTSTASTASSAASSSAATTTPLPSNVGPGAAPVVDVGPGVGSGIGACANELAVGPKTSCSFAESVYRAVSQARQRDGYVPGHVTAYSPVTKKSYTLTCEIDNIPDIACSTPSGAIVSMPY